MKIRRLVVLVAAVSVAGALAGSLAAASTPNPAVCGGFHLQGRSYLVGAYSGGCGMARTWSPRLARRAPVRASSSYVELAGAPTGYTCVAVYTAGRVSGGGCVRTATMKLAFVWARPATSARLV